MSLGIVGGSHVGSSWEAMATSVATVLKDTKIGGLKLEMPEKYIGSRVPTISGWLTKMERYFTLMKYHADIWLDGIATRIARCAVVSAKSMG